MYLYPNFYFEIVRINFYLKFAFKFKQAACICLLDLVMSPFKLAKSFSFSFRISLNCFLSVVKLFHKLAILASSAWTIPRIQIWPFNSIKNITLIILHLIIRFTRNLKFFLPKSITFFICFSEVILEIFDRLAEFYIFFITSLELLSEDLIQLTEISWKNFDMFFIIQRFNLYILG